VASLLSEINILYEHAKKKRVLCPVCKEAAKKNGAFRGVQRFKCSSCRKQFQHEKRGVPDVAVLWREWAHEHATFAVLATRYKRSERWIRDALDAYTPQRKQFAPRPMVAIMDATRVGASWILVVRDALRGENVYAETVSSETSADYQEAKRRLEEQGFTFLAIVGDGRVATPWLFPKVPTQMCHFHQLQIVIRYVTLRPKLAAGIELLELAYTLPKTDEASFTDAFSFWCKEWHTFLQEKSTDPKTGHTFWTHKRLRQARDSLRAHLPYLFTFQRFPELNIPNTANGLDGSFKKVKVAIAVHAGLPLHRKLKLIRSLLQGDV
jgi:hypothetical protein